MLYRAAEGPRDRTPRARQFNRARVSAHWGCDRCRISLRAVSCDMPHRMVDLMQTRAKLYAAIGLHDYEALDASIIQTIIPTGNPQ